MRVDTAHQMECDPPVETRAQRHHVHQVGQVFSILSLHLICALTFTCVMKEVIIIDDTPSPVFQEDIAELKMRYMHILQVRIGVCLTLKAL